MSSPRTFAAVRRSARADIVTTLSSSTRFRTWTTILVRTLFVDDLREGKWVVVAPTDVAFTKLGPRVLDRLFAPGSLERLVDLAERCIQRIDADRSLAPRSSVMLLPSVLASGTPIVERFACANGLVWAVDDVQVTPRVPTPGRGSRPPE